MLQVENVFHLQVLGEGDDTQLSLSWRTLDDTRIRRLMFVWDVELFNLTKK